MRDCALSHMSAIFGHHHEPMFRTVSEAWIAIGRPHTQCSGYQGLQLYQASGLCASACRVLGLLCVESWLRRACSYHVLSCHDVADVMSHVGQHLSLEYGLSSSTPLP